MDRNRFSHSIQKPLAKLLCLLSIFAFLAVVMTPNPVVSASHVKATLPQMKGKPEICTELGPSSIGAASLKDRIWKGKHTLRVRFLGGSEFLREKVRYYAQAWSNYANIQFQFVDSSPSDIRVSFDLDGSSWSYIGTSAKSVDEDEPTVHFGWFVENTSEIVFRRTILHEFGHVLGLIHEHQSPSATINWNKFAVYNYYKNHFEWNENVVNDKIFRKYQKTRTQYTAYDPESIMHYPIPSQFTTDGTSVTWNTHLSQTDITFIKQLYP